ncbi:MAG: hypothetical protein ACREBU_03250, partial [Nitrososphaera sp.]
ADRTNFRSWLLSAMDVPDATRHWPGIPIRVFYIGLAALYFIRFGRRSTETTCSLSITRMASVDAQVAGNANPAWRYKTYAVVNAQPNAITK